MTNPATLLFAQGTSTPVSTPSAGQILFYSKNDNNFYSLNSLGVESLLVGNPGTVTSVAVAGTSGEILSSGGPITANGTITLSLAPTAVTAGTYTAANITVDAYGRITAAANGSGGGGGTVTSVSVVTANGISGTVSEASTTPQITLSLGAITPTSIVATGTISGSNLSGTNTGDQTITLTGDVSGTGTGSFIATLATVNSTPGTFTNATITVDSKGRVTSATNGGAGGVTSFNTRTGAITLTSSDVDIALGYVPGTVTSVGISGTAGQIISTGSPITSSGTYILGLATTTVTAGSYTNANVTIDSFGRITTASNGTAGVTSFNTRTGAISLTSSDVTSALGFTPYNSSNPTGYITSSGNAATATSIAGGIANEIVYQSAAGVSTFISAPSVANSYLQWTGSAFTWSTVAGGGVVSFSAGTTGLTPSTATLGAIVLAGTLNVSNGGTGLTSVVTGEIPYGNSTGPLTTSANLSFDGISTLTVGSPSSTAGALSSGTGQSFTISGSTVLNLESAGTTAGNGVNIVLTSGTSAKLSITGPTAINYATSLQPNDVPNTQYVTTAIANGSVASANLATNMLGGLANQIPFQTGTNTTAFITAPTTASTFLEWNGSTFIWGTAGSSGTATNIAGGASNEIAYQTATNTTSFIAAPSVSGTYLEWTGTSFAWNTVSGGSGSSPGLQATYATVSLAANGVINIGSLLPVNSVISRVKVLITNSDSTAQLSVGTSTATFMTTTQNIPSVVGIYVVETLVVEASSVQVIATVTSSAGTPGAQCIVFVEYSVGTTLVGLQGVYATVPLSANGVTSVGSIVPIGAIISRVKVLVTATDSTAALTVGTSAANFMSATQNTPSVIGLYSIDTLVVISTPSSLIATVASTAGTSGASCVVYIEYLI